MGPGEKRRRRRVSVACPGCFFSDAAGSQPVFCRASGLLEHGDLADTSHAGHTPFFECKQSSHWRTIPRSAFVPARLVHHKMLQTNLQISYRFGIFQLDPRVVDTSAVFGDLRAHRGAIRAGAMARSRPGDPAAPERRLPSLPPGGNGLGPTGDGLLPS
jgi:hypothetical protein